MGREHMNTLTRMRAVLSSPSLYQLAAALEWDRPVGRPPVNPTYVTLAYGVLARLNRSGIRVELDLAEPTTWEFARNLMTHAISEHHLELDPPGREPPTWHHWRWLRDHHLATEDGAAALARAWPAIAVGCARRIGLLDPHGPGSFTHPDSTRTIYGDGTLVRPIYNPPETVTITLDDGSTTTAYPHPRTGELLEHPPGRYDPDLLAHHGRLGPVLTHGYVIWHARGPGPYQRVDLALAHIPAPGAEAATAVALLRDVHRAAGPGIQAVVYDGAFRGTHIDHIMRSYGYLVMAKQGKYTPTDHSPNLVQTPSGRRARSFPLEPVTHDTPDGPCTHLLATIDGAVVALDLNEAGDPTVVATLTRGPVKRARRAGGQYHFNVGYTLACPRGETTVWLQPHATKDGNPHRPDQLRVIPTSDPDAQRLMGIRSDAESFHAMYKRTLIVNRAMSLGATRGLLDLYCFALYNNALTEYRHHQQTLATSTQRRSLRTLRRATR